MGSLGYHPHADSHSHHEQIHKPDRLSASLSLPSSRFPQSFRLETTLHQPEPLHPSTLFLLKSTPTVHPGFPIPLATCFLPMTTKISNLSQKDLRFWIVIPIRRIQRHTLDLTKHIIVPHLRYGDILQFGFVVLDDFDGFHRGWCHGSGFLLLIVGRKEDVMK